MEESPKWYTVTGLAKEGIHLRAKVLDNGKINFVCSFDTHSVLTRSEALTAIQLAKDHKFSAIVVQHIRLGPVLTEDELRTMLRQELIERKGLTREDLQLLTS